MPKHIPDSDKVELKDAFVDRYKALLGPDYGKFIEYSFSYLRKSIRINTLKADVEEIKRRLARWSPPPLKREVKSYLRRYSAQVTSASTGAILKQP